MLGKAITYTAITDEAARDAMLSHGMPAFYADYLIDLNRYYRTGAGARVSTAVRDITGQPARSFEEFARDHARAWG